MSVCFEGGKGDGKTKGLMKLALEAWLKGFDVKSTDFCQMPNRGGAGGWHECEIVHVDDLMDKRGNKLRSFDNTFYAVQDAWSELDARLSNSSKRLNGMVGFAMTFRHYDNWLGADSQRFGDLDLRIRTTTEHRVWCLKGDTQFLEIWLDRIRGDVAVEKADLDVVKELGQLYHTKTREIKSHLIENPGPEVVG